VSDLHCLHCGATTHNGLVLCSLCQTHVRDVFDDLPVYFRNLARWRPGRAGSRPVPGSRVLYDGEVHADESSDRISNALNEVGNAVSTWARSLADDRGIELPDGDSETLVFAATCALLAGHVVSIATLEWAGELVRDLDHHERRLHGLTLVAVPGWYAGSCRRRLAMATDEDDGLCGATTYVLPGLSTVTCQACGSTTFARDHVETILAEAADWVAPPRRIAEAVVALVDTEESVTKLHDRIRQWGSRKAIEVIRATPYAPKRYRLGAVVNLLATEGATRIAEEVEPDTAVEAV
jgi:hypothetical protein